MSNCHNCPYLATKSTKPLRACLSTRASSTGFRRRATDTEVTRTPGRPRPARFSNRSASRRPRGQPLGAHFLLSRPLCRLPVGEFQSRGTNGSVRTRAGVLGQEQGASFEKRNCRRRVMVGPGPAASAAAGKCGRQPPAEASRPPPAYFSLPQAQIASGRWTRVTQQGATRPAAACGHPGIAGYGRNFDRSQKADSASVRVLAPLQTDC